MDNEISTKSSDEIIRHGITEKQWRVLESYQKYNWRIALFCIVAISYLVLYLSCAKLLSLGGIPKWVSHVIGIYSSCCLLLLTSGEREYSSLLEKQRKIIDLVWTFGGALLSLTGGTLFVLFIASAFWIGIVPIMVEDFSKGHGPELLGYVLVSIALLIAIYIQFNGFLISCFKIPRKVAKSWILAARTGKVPLAGVECTLAAVFPLGHIIVVGMLSALMSLWS
ncbi:hypothetical protein [Pseudoalteromonas sp. PB2-1]|uniref:hypothetical protein n=1 Tax=Pseudoalteromonas sp. PB2-1 TaxID=2907242 RepID=UPI003867842D